MELRTDEAREGAVMGCGIMVRALSQAGQYESFDIAELDRQSLFVWLRSRGGSNPWAENVVLVLLGHMPVTEEERSTWPED